MRLAAVEIPRMKIVGARQTKKMNILRIQCQVGHVFDHKADLDIARCPKCNRTGNCIGMEKEGSVGEGR